ncbi:unnamed protein product, partial [Choristocarpus tenellus]
ASKNILGKETGVGNAEKSKATVEGGLGGLLQKDALLRLDLALTGVPPKQSRKNVSPPRMCRALTQPLHHSGHWAWKEDGIPTVGDGGTPNSLMMDSEEELGLRDDRVGTPALDRDSYSGAELSPTSVTSKGSRSGVAREAFSTPVHSGSGIVKGGKVGSGVKGGVLREVERREWAGAVPGAGLEGLV